MTMRRVFGNVDAGGVPQNGILVRLYKATRCAGSPPPEGTPPPVGSPDAGPVTTGPGFGGEGTWAVDLPTDEDYCAHAWVNNADTWALIPADQDTGSQEHAFAQNSAAATWNVAHGLSKHPAVTVIDSGGTLVEGDVVYVDQDHIRITFAVPFAGVCYLS